MFGSRFVGELGGCWIAELRDAEVSYFACSKCFGIQLLLRRLFVSRNTLRIEIQQ